jgi:hypothetical protein
MLPIPAFFSCSYRDEDKPINDIIVALCKGLGIECRNLDAGDTQVPAEAARTMIEESQIFIAVAVARDQIGTSGKYSMPSAVRDEIGAAFGLRKPMLLLRENNVPIDGFTGSYSTHMEFKREEIQTPDFLQRAVRSIHALRLVATASQDGSNTRGTMEFYAERVSHAISILRKDDVFVWRHSSQRRIVFTRPMQRPLNIFRWNDTADQSRAAGLEPIDVKIEPVEVSRKIKMTPIFNKRSAFGVDAQVAFSPSPGAGDVIEYYVSFEGPHLCNTYLDEMNPERTVTIGGRSLNAYEGIYFLNQAREFELEFRFAREYGLSRDDFEFFAGAYTDRVDFVDESEIARASVRKYLSGGDVCFQAQVKNVIPGYMYGVAWTPPSRPV